MTAIIWTDESEASLAGTIMRRVSSLLPAKKQSSSSADDTPPIYATIFDAPLRRRSDFKKATELALPQLMPLAPEELLIYGRRSAEGVELAAIRKADMKAWVSATRGRRTIRTSSGWTISPAVHTEASNRGWIALAVGWCALLLAGVGLQVSTLFVLNGQLSQVQEKEQRARALAMSTARKQEEANLWSTLEKARAPARLPAAVLGRIAELSRATPEGAAWTRLDWSPDSVTIGGAAADPVAVLGAISAIKEAKAAFSKPVVRSNAGKQEFEIVVTYVEAAS